MSNVIVVDHVQVRPSQIVVYPELYGCCRKLAGEEISRKNLQKKKFSGEISKKTQRHIIQTVEYMALLTKQKGIASRKKEGKLQYRLTFVTLTLQSKQVHTDNELKHSFLNQFLIEARMKWNITSYVWRAEKQKNGNIHFHVVFNKYVHWSAIRNTWNRICAKMGYLVEYEKEHGHSDANSTDVHAFYKIKNVAKYVAKYISKKSENNAVLGKMWGCSSDLSNIKNADDLITYDLGFELNDLLNKYPDRVIIRDYVTIFNFSVYDLYSLNCQFLLKLFFNNLQQYSDTLLYIPQN